MCVVVVVVVVVVSKMSYTKARRLQKNAEIYYHFSVFWTRNLTELKMNYKDLEQLTCKANRANSPGHTAIVFFDQRNVYT